jgi:hypothetical protein
MSIRSTQLSRDGQWLVYALVPQDGDGELVVRNLKTDKEFRSPRGNQPVITVRRQIRRVHDRPVKGGGGQGQERQEETRGAAQERPGHHGPVHGRGDDRRPGQELQSPRGVRGPHRLPPRAAVEEAGGEEGGAEKRRAQGGAGRQTRGEKKEEPKKRRRRRSPATISSSASWPREKRRRSPRSSNMSGTSPARGWPTPSPPRRRRTTAPSLGSGLGERTACSKGSATTRT